MELSRIPYETLGNFLSQSFVKIKHNKDIEVLQQYYHNKGKIQRKSKTYTYKEDNYIIEFKSGQSGHIIVIRPIKKNITELISSLMTQYHFWYNKYQYAYLKYIQGNSSKETASQLNIAVSYIKNIKTNVNLLEQYLIDINSENTKKVDKLKEENAKIDDSVNTMYLKFQEDPKTKKIGSDYFEKLKQKNKNIKELAEIYPVNYLVLQPAMLYKVKH
jgi:hypothetical protein